jgi:hypothetical protein
MVDYPAIQPDQVQPRRPGNIGFVDSVIHLIDIRVDAVLQGLLAVPGNRSAFFNRFRWNSPCLIRA